MRLYAVEYASDVRTPMYYWANNGEDAIDKHRRQTGTDALLIASAVWANNKEMTYRGYVVKED